MPKPFTMINLDRPRKLRYSTNALVAMEEALGQPIGTVMHSFEIGAVGFKDIRTILWAGLIDGDPSLTQEQVGDMMDEAESLAYISEKVGEALSNAMLGPKSKEAAELKNE